MRQIYKSEQVKRSTYEALAFDRGKGSRGWKLRRAVDADWDSWAKLCAGGRFGDPVQIFSELVWARAFDKVTVDPSLVRSSGAVAGVGVGGGRGMGVGIMASRRPVVGGEARGREIRAALGLNTRRYANLVVLLDKWLADLDR